MQTLLLQTWFTANRHRRAALALMMLTAIVLMAIGLDKGGCAPPPVYPGG
jgi:hypothetical protein